MAASVVLCVLQADKRRSTATSSGGAAGGGRGRRTQGDEELEAGEGLSLQCPDLMPHFLIEVRPGCALLGMLGCFFRQTGEQLDEMRGQGQASDCNVSTAAKSERVRVDSLCCCWLV